MGLSPITYHRASSAIALSVVAFSRLFQDAHSGRLPVIKYNDLIHHIISEVGWLAPVVLGLQRSGAVRCFIHLGGFFCQYAIRTSDTAMLSKCAARCSLSQRASCFSREWRCRARFPSSDRRASANRYRWVLRIGGQHRIRYGARIR